MILSQMILSSPTITCRWAFAISDRPTSEPSIPSEFEPRIRRATSPGGMPELSRNSSAPQFFGDSRSLLASRFKIRACWERVEPFSIPKSWGWKTHALNSSHRHFSPSASGWKAGFWVEAEKLKGRIREGRVILDGWREEFESPRRQIREGGGISALGARVCNSLLVLLSCAEGLRRDVTATIGRTIGRKRAAAAVWGALVAFECRVTQFHAAFAMEEAVFELSF
jgi:hypothetical protein